ncbi:MAG: monovalent cation/H(+) antiporter subunit G [Hyphomicrobiaceae bacterium]|nr:MAG: monovalent cation/H(+) antiporter subunit G [Hyphomicrobiaceae bacterium]
MLIGLSWALILAGGFFTIVGAIGLVRMPDVYTRMHAASVTDTLGAGLLLLGFMLQAGPSLVLLKLVFLFVLFFFVSPVATHAVANAALHYGIKPQLAEDRRGRLDADTREPAAIEEELRIEAAQ